MAGTNLQLNPAELGRLKVLLQANYVPHLPPLLPNTQSADEIAKKQLSRAFAAFALSELCGLTPQNAASRVVDDFYDGGVDAIYLSVADRKLYFVQGKLKEGAEFKQAEALKFLSGVKKLVCADIADFNDHIRNRVPTIEDELDSCREIHLVVSYVGSGISMHARNDISHVTGDKDQDEKRFEHPFIEFGPREVRRAMDARMARPKIVRDIKLLKCKQISEPRETWIGVAKLDDLVAIHEDFGDALFDRNLRNPLSDKTAVNKAIYASLEQKRHEFFYLNNGITALADKVEAGTAKEGGQTLHIRGLSIVNGAQSISTASRFKTANPLVNTEDAKVTLTIITAGADGEFGKAVTRARNHQNAVFSTDFAALEDDQERLRRELKARGIVYAYKSQDLDPTAVVPTVTIEEAAFGLALLDNHPLNPWLLRTNQDAFRTPGEEEYQRVFPADITSERVVNAAYVGRALAKYIREQITAASNPQDKDILRHAAFAHSWVLAKRFRNGIEGAMILDEARIAAETSSPADVLRQRIIDVVAAKPKRAWICFRNQGDLLQILEEVMVADYQNTVPAAVAAKKAERPVRQGSRGRPVPLYDYPKPLFDYLAARAPQIGNLI